MSGRLDRYEIKLLIDHSTRQALLEEMGKRVTLDANSAGETSYPVVSLYYDTRFRDCYWEKQIGQKERRKFRVRVYGSPQGLIAPTSFVEVKHKSQGRGVKRRLKLPLDQALAVGRGEWPDAVLGTSKERIVREVHRLVETHQFQPACLMRYDRQAFSGVEQLDLRITFDTGLAFRMHDLTPSPDDRDFEHMLLDDDVSVMEIKTTTAVPLWLTRMLASHNLRIGGFSKYCAALDRGCPEIARLRDLTKEASLPRPADVFPATL